VTVDTLSRAVEAYRRTASSRSAILLVAANLIPLVGVVFFGWSLWTILVLYWVENGIVGFWNVPKILLAQGSVLPRVVAPIPDDAALAASGWNPARAAKLRAAWDEARAAQQRALDAANAANPPSASEPAPAVYSGIRVLGQPVGGSAGRTAMALFFCLHYGIFWFVHGIFIFALPMFFGGAGPLSLDCQGLPPTFDPGSVTFNDPAVCGTPFGDIVWSNVLLGAVVLFLSHGASFLFNYIGRGEYLTASAMRQTAAPYGRVVILHLTILFGAFAVAALGAPIGALLILVGLKTAFDLLLHLRERRFAAPPLPNPTL
jgi:hypothetical protein